VELSSGQQRLLFAVVVLLLAGLGVYLIGPGAHHGTAAPTPSPSPSSSPSSSAPAISASNPPVIAQSATAPPIPPASSPVTSGGASIYQWLPFTQQDLTEAARTTLAFASDYETFSYTETAAAYAQKMVSLVTGELGATLENAYAAPGAEQTRSAQKQVSTGSGGIASIRAFGTGPTSITFVVNIAQQLATTKGTSTSTMQYAVTLVSAAGGWEVNDIELADQGNS
jgi:hypothetical protein